jgi:hypothetical protein
VTEIAYRAMEEIQLSEKLCDYEVVLKKYKRFFGINFKSASINALEKVPTFRL